MRAQQADREELTADDVDLGPLQMGYDQALRAGPVLDVRPAVLFAETETTHTRSMSAPLWIRLPLPTEGCSKVALAAFRLSIQTQGGRTVPCAVEDWCRTR